MSDFTYTVTVTAETIEQAEQVMAERLSHDEDYGFTYFIEYDSNRKVCPIDGGKVTNPVFQGLWVCTECQEILYPHELVTVATAETQEAYFKDYPRF